MTSSFPFKSLGPRGLWVNPESERDLPWYAANRNLPELPAQQTAAHRVLQLEVSPVKGVHLIPKNPSFWSGLGLQTLFCPNALM